MTFTEQAQLAARMRATAGHRGCRGHREHRGARTWRDIVLNGGPDADAIMLAQPEPWGGSMFWDDLLESHAGLGPQQYSRVLADLLDRDQRGSHGLPPRATVPSGPRFDLSAIKSALGLH
jgi:hypothetical protein